MKNILKGLTLLVFMYSSSYGQKTNGFVLHGDIKGLKDGTSIFLTSKNKDTISSTKTIGSKFILTGVVKGEANYYFLKIDTSFRKKASNALWLINDNMSVSGYLKDWQNLVLIGSEPQNVWLAFKELRDKNVNKKEWEMMRILFIEKHLNSMFTPYLLSSSSFIVQEDMFSKLGNQAKNSFYGLEIAEKIRLGKISNEIRHSGEIPNFLLKMTDGKAVSIHELASKFKYTLIDFWASWCVPCREAIPELNKTYGAFRDKGFNIIGVAWKDSETAWKRALAEDKTPWIHAVDNIESAGTNIFGLMAVPGYILIDQKGKIIQSELTNADDKQIKTFKDKSLSQNLYEIIEILLREEKSK